MTDRKKLREAATKATPGEWIAENTMGDIVMIMQVDASDVNGWGACVAQVGLEPADEDDLPREQAQANAEFIALASPKAIIALLDELDRQEPVAGFRDVELDMIKRGDMLGPELGARVFAALTAGHGEPVAQCCMCGKKGLSTVEGDGGSECQLNDGRWTCSADCYDRALAPSPAGRETVTEEMVERGCEQAGWLVEPYTAPREGGVPVETDISESDAEEINAQVRSAMREILEAALGAQP